VLQHEAFHQFAAAVKGPDLPGWLNEGLAEYFGESLFTGDDYVTDVIPAWRAARVKKAIEEGTFKPLEELLRMTQDDWNSKVAVANYDQAWSVVQYIVLAHPEGRHHLAGCVKEILAGKTSAFALAGVAGPGLAGFEQRWREYWLKYRDDDPRLKASVATVTSFLARATAHGHRFETFNQFLEAYRRGNVRLPAEDWLPSHMLEASIAALPPDTEWRIHNSDGLPWVDAAIRPGRGLRIAVGTFKLRDGRVVKVNVDEGAFSGG
jgi:hypothetical protein